MAQTISFRSAVNGFHRGDVIKYIGELMEENATLKKQVETLRVLSKTLTAESAAQKAEVERLQDALKNAETQPKDSGRQLDAARLGEAMYDARRFSDLLVSEADEKISAMLTSAAGTAEASAARVGSLSAQTDALRTETAQTLQKLTSSLKKLQAEMQGFCSEVNDNHAAFLQEFTSAAKKKFEEDKA